MYLKMESCVKISANCAQLSPLKTIGIAQMERELVKNFKSAEKRYANLETTQDNSEENIKQIVHEVLQELKQKDFGKRKQS
jgi:hypothetical protein